MRTAIFALTPAILLLAACGPPAGRPVEPAPVSDEAMEPAAEPAPEPAAEPAPRVADVDAVGLETPADVAAPPPEASVTASGLASRVLRSGDGTEHPSPTDRVTVHYTGWTTDGQMFDSSVERGSPATFPLNGVIGGWTEGVQLMVEGEIRRFWIPPELAYGRNPRPGAPAGMLVFDVELIRIED